MCANQINLDDNDNANKTDTKCILKKNYRKEINRKKEISK